MKILVLGAGAVGLAVAAKLSSVCDVHAVTRKQTADAINAGGLRLTGIWGTGTFRFSVSDSIPKDACYDYIIITAKSRDTEAICRAVRGSHSHYRNRQSPERDRERGDHQPVYGQGDRRDDHHRLLNGRGMPRVHVSARGRAGKTRQVPGRARCTGKKARGLYEAGRHQYRRKC